MTEALLRRMGGAPGPGAHPDCGQRQGVRRSPGDLRRAGGGALPCDSLPLPGAGPERARQWPGAPVLPEGHRPDPGHGGRSASGRGLPEPPPRKVPGCRTPFEVFHAVLPSP
ncbi:MAG: hypothetical protein OXF20_02670 [Gammaproteobacteria bacterium]|nr:hypothetical protein [Gammaproteobacteria bacterium]